MSGHAGTRDTRNPLADLIGLSDDELMVIAEDIRELLAAEPVDVEALRQLLADWALTVRIRSHPGFTANAEAFSVVMAGRDSVTA